MAPPTRSAKKRTIADEVRSFTYNLVPKTAFVIVLIHITLTLVYTFQYRQAFPSAGAIAITALYGSCLILFAMGALLLRCLGRTARRDIGDVEDNNPGVRRFNMSAGDEASQASPGRVPPAPPIRVQPPVQVPAGLAPILEVQEAPSDPAQLRGADRDNINNQHRQPAANVQQDQAFLAYRPLESLDLGHPRQGQVRPQQHTPRHSRQTESRQPANAQQNLAQQYDSPPDRQQGAGPLVINNPDEGQSRIVPQQPNLRRSHSGRLSWDSSRRRTNIPEVIPEERPENLEPEPDLNSEVPNRHTRYSRANGRWLEAQRDDRLNSSATATHPPPRVSSLLDPQVQRGQDSHPGNPAPDNNHPNSPNQSPWVINLMQLDYDTYEHYGMAALFFAGTKDPKEFLRRLDSLIREVRTMRRWGLISSTEATEAEDTDATEADCSPSPQSSSEGGRDESETESELDRRLDEEWEREQWEKYDRIRSLKAGGAGCCHEVRRTSCYEGLVFEGVGTGEAYGGSEEGHDSGMAEEGIGEEKQEEGDQDEPGGQSEEYEDSEYYEEKE